MLMKLAIRRTLSSEHLRCDHVAEVHEYKMSNCQVTGYGERSARLTASSCQELHESGCIKALRKLVITYKQISHGVIL